MHDVNQNSCQRWWWRRNGHAICLKCFPKINILFSLQIAQKEERKSLHLKARTLAPTLNGLTKGINQNCLVPIASNKNGWLSNKNLVTNLISATNVVLPKYELLAQRTLWKWGQSLHKKWAKKLNSAPRRTTKRQPNQTFARFNHKPHRNPMNKKKFKRKKMIRIVLMMWMSSREGKI